MKMNDIRFIKQNGGIGRTAESGDPISGLIVSGKNLVFGNGNIVGFDQCEVDSNDDVVSYVKRLRYLEELEDCGVKFKEYDGTTALADVEKAHNFIHYHVKEFFRINPEGTLYLMLKTGTADVVAGDVAKMQQYAEGAIRQIGLLCESLIAAADIQTVCTELEQNHMPLSVIVTYNGKSVETATLTGATLKSAGKCNVSVCVGCDVQDYLLNNLGDNAYCGAIGTLLGCLSKASVNESIAWVAKFPLGMVKPALFNGIPIRDLSVATQETLNANGYIFVRTFVGNADNYFNDSFTLDVDTSDYAYIENVRTIDKACRGVRANLLPYLNSPLRVNAQNGQLAPDTVAFLEVVANKALEDMEKANEISGYKVEIDPTQDVLATSEVKIVIKQVPTGVMRQISIKIGFTKSI